MRWREVALLVLVMLLAALSAWVAARRAPTPLWRAWHRLPSVARRDVAECKANLKRLHTPLEMYSTDNWGRYPARLSALVPDYLDALPTCPVARRDTYTRGFESASNPDAYTASCLGWFHQAARTQPNKPACDSSSHCCYYER